MQDLQVTDILPQMITLSEAYIQASHFSMSSRKCGWVGEMEKITMFFP